MLVLLDKYDEASADVMPEAQSDDVVGLLEVSFRSSDTQMLFERFFRATWVFVEWSGEKHLYTVKIRIKNYAQMWDMVDPAGLLSWKKNLQIQWMLLMCCGARDRDVKWVDIYPKKSK